MVYLLLLFDLICGVYLFCFGGSWLFVAVCGW